MSPPQKRKIFRTPIKACLAAVLCVAAWGSPAPAPAASAVEYYEISVSVNPSQTLSNVFIIYDYYYLDAEGGVGEQVVVNSIAQTLMGNPTTPYSFIIPGNGPVDHFGKYTLLGVHNTTENLVTVALNNVAANAAIGPPPQEWSSIFPPGDPFTEAQVAGYLQNGDQNSLDNLSNFFQNYSGQFTPLNTDSTLVNFSLATNGGTVSAQAAVVPLPPTLALVLPGLGAILILRRRQKSSGPRNPFS
jgi:hypothetical protein